MISNCQLKFGDLYNIYIGNIKKSVSTFFNKGKYVLHYENHNGWIQHTKKE